MSVNKTGRRWLRVLFAGLLTEISVILVIVCVVSVYRYALSSSEADYQSFAGRAGYYIGTFGGALAALLFAWWVGRALKTDFLINGFLVACVAVILHVGLLVASGTGFQTAYAMADALKLAGGLLGGYLARKTLARSTIGRGPR